MYLTHSATFFKLAEAKSQPIAGYKLGFWIAHGRGVSVDITKPSLYFQVSGDFFC
jgi:hypothetical protein